MTAMSLSLTVFPPFFLQTFVFREAQIIFKAGRNCDGYFSAKDLFTQVNSAINIFEGLSKGNFNALFLFDNAPSHQKQALDAILAWKTAKGVPPSLFTLYSLTSIATAPKRGWTHHMGGPHMRCGQLPNGDVQSFYFLNDHPSMPRWFKGIEWIIQEHSLWLAKGLNMQCQNFHCPPE